MDSGFLHVESGIWEIFACGIRNSANDWNLESKFYWQGMRNAVPRFLSSQRSLWSHATLLSFMGRGVSWQHKEQAAYVTTKPSTYNWKNSFFKTPGCKHEISDEKISVLKPLFHCLTSFQWFRDVKIAQSGDYSREFYVYKISIESVSRMTAQEIGVISMERK